MEMVEPGNVIFMFAKGVGIIGIGKATGRCETLNARDPDRVSNIHTTIEWRIPTQWLHGPTQMMPTVESPIAILGSDLYSVRVPHKALRIHESRSNKAGTQRRGRASTAFQGFLAAAGERWIVKRLSYLAPETQLPYSDRSRRDSICPA